jgi:hypothetical protein
MDTLTIQTIVLTPLNSLLELKEDQRISYIENFFQTPPSVRQMLFSLKTGAFIRGLAKTYDLPDNKTSFISLLILKIAIGEKSLPQLAGILSTELQLPNDKAQKIAQEIERELFAPVALELNQYLKQKKSIPPAADLTHLPPNTLNLKTPPK